MATSDEIKESKVPSRRAPRSQEAVAKDVRRVEALLTQGEPRWAIVAKLSRGERPLSDRTVDRYIEQVRQRWKREHLLRDETKVEERLRQLQETREALWRDRKPLVVGGEILRGARYDATIARYDEMINDILGVNAPTQHEVKAAVLVAQAPAIDWSKLSDGELEALERVAGLLPAPSAPQGALVVGGEPRAD